MESDRHSTAGAVERGNVVMPLVGMLMGGVDFSQLFIALDGKAYATMEALDKAGAPAIKYGVFINDTISFLILVL